MTTFERVSLLALIYFIGRTLGLFLRHAVNLIPLLVVIVTGGEQLRGILLWVLPIALPLIVVLHALMSWWFFRYRAADQTLHLREGILKRTQLTLEYDRIQQADIRQPWYFRPFGLAVLGVESAGSEGREVELAGLLYARAELLRQAMMMQKPAQTDTPKADDAQAADLQITLPVTEIARYGLIHNPVLLIIPVLAYPLSQFDLIDDWLLPRLEGFVFTVSNGGSIFQSALLWSAMLLLALVLVVAISVVIAIVRYHGFTLSVSGQRYQTRAGLLTIVSRSFQYVRLQRLVWKQGLVARLLKRKGLRIDQSGRPDTLQQAKTFFIPILAHDRELELRQALGQSEPAWQSVHPMSMALPWVFCSALVVFVAALASDWEMYWIGVAAVFALPLTGLLVWAGWRQRGVFVDDDWLALRRGLIGHQQRWIPACKMQTLSVTQGPWLRVWGMSALHVYSAAGRETIAWLPSPQIEDLQMRLMTRTGDYRGRWM
ncbi:MAG: PH domain-containing protein [Pseudohongiella sp.]